MTDSYCRDVEAYLCRKNDGHLVRIVGPAFEQVTGWATRGIPITAVYRGIDRYFERYYAKGPRRRPVRVEFCEADVLDVFDEWRKAVGVTGQAVGGQGPGGQSARGTGGSGQGEAGGVSEPRHKDSLPAHLERVVARLTALRSSSYGVSGFPGRRSAEREGGSRTGGLNAAVDQVVRDLDAARSAAKGLRGDARAAFLDRLRALDAALLEAARADCDPATLEALRAEADLELAPFRDRMPGETYGRSREACVDRLIRERARLPIVAFE